MRKCKLLLPLHGGPIYISWYLKTPSINYFFVLNFNKEFKMTHCFSAEDNQVTRAPQDVPQMLDRIGDYSVVSQIALSGQASIYLARKADQLYALKVYEASPRLSKTYNNEVNTLVRVDCRGIVPLEECISGIDLPTVPGRPSGLCNIIVMPYLRRGDLLEWVLAHNKIADKPSRYLALQLISRFRYLESKQILHRDIKAQNILIGDDYLPLLIDFGLSTDEHQAVKGFAGTVRYAAPQVLKEKEYTSKSQIYSLGILFFFMLTGNYPYSKAKITQHGYRLLFQHKYSQFWTAFESAANITVSQSFKELFVRMVDHVPENRPSLDELMEFSWFKENQMTQLEFKNYMQAKEQGLQQ